MKSIRWLVGWFVVYSLYIIVAYLMLIFLDTHTQTRTLTRAHTHTHICIDDL